MSIPVFDCLNCGHPTLHKSHGTASGHSGQYEIFRCCICGKVKTKLIHKAHDYEEQDDETDVGK